MVKLFSLKRQRHFGLAAVVLCVVYCVLLLIGAWTYVSTIYLLDIEAEDLPIPQWVPYIILPIGLTLLLLRFVQVGVRVARGDQAHLVADEAGDVIEEFAERGGAADADSLFSDRDREP